MSLDDNINLRVEGYELLKSKLKRLVGIPRQVVGPIVLKYALKIQNNARRRVRVDTGDTRRSILMRMIGFSNLTAAIGSDKDAAAWIEKGTKPHMPPADALLPWVQRHGMKPGAAYAIARKIARSGTRDRPFLYPAWKDEAPGFVTEASEAIKNATEGV